MVTPNYGFEKRQKELAKKRKKEEKIKLRGEKALPAALDPDVPEVQKDKNSLG